MECLGTMPLLAPPQPTISQTFCWTDADSLDLEQICKDLRISETKTDPFMSSSACPSQFQPDVLRTQEAPSSKAAACPKKCGSNYKRRERPFLRSSDEWTRQRCQMGGIKSCSRTQVRSKAKARAKVRRRPRRLSSRRGRVQPTTPWRSR